MCGRTYVYRFCTISRGGVIESALVPMARIVNLARGGCQSRWQAPLKAARL
jgi:hypothetical protein